jgi:TolA-binding protein
MARPESLRNPAQGDTASLAQPNYSLASTPYLKAENRLLRERLSGERQLESRIAELERKIGQLTMENDLLKKTEEHMRRRQSENASIVSGPAPSASKRGAK